MCGRYSQTKSLEELKLRFGFKAPGSLACRAQYNIAPSQQAPVVVKGAARELRSMRWGLVPSWGPMRLCEQELDKKIRLSVESHFDLVAREKRTGKWSG